MRQFLLSVREIGEVLLISLVTVYLVRTFLAQPFLVSGASMEPNFVNGNYLIIDEVTYRFREPERGEVVVFRYPGDHKTFYIKRVIGLPRERIVLDRGIIKIFNDAHPTGVVLVEGYLPAGLDTAGRIDLALGSSDFFVLGDNRYYSYDSRSWGLLNRVDIVGVVRARLFPFQQVQLFDAPQYSF